MIEMLKARKEELQAQGKKGFTLMEMLIVIAIIAVLIAIAIPVFTAQLDNAKKAADEANARSIYAIAMADYMDNNKYDNTYTFTAASGTSPAKVTVAGGTSPSQEFEFSDKAGTVTITTTTGTGGTETAVAPYVEMSGYGDVKFGTEPA